MDDRQSEKLKDELARVQEALGQRDQELETLKKQLEREQFARELSKVLAYSTISNIILSPFTHSRLLEMVVSTAMQVISALSGSLFLIDEETQDLTFEIALGPSAQEAKKFRVPLGHGIAGMVAMTGQPMAIADAQQDDRLAVDIATSIDYIPKSILCVPLFYNDRIIGALELLDKIDASSFLPMDMKVLGLFANIAAIAIAQSHAYHDQQTILTSLLQAFGKRDPEYQQNLSHQALNFSNWMQNENTINTLGRELALLVHELIQASEQDGEMCRQILQVIVTNSRNRYKYYDVMATKR
ncbi:MAG TPA: GAF domain-containing protein [Ktedonobacteraceae bacterium]|nr:GAF domain-containing protein [Ktedonobacteraceae bacterium]